MALSAEGIKIEGCSEAEVLALPTEHLEMLILSGEPLALRAGQRRFSELSVRLGPRF